VADLGLDSRSVTVSGGRQGLFGFDLVYDEIPYRLFDSTRTVFRQSADGSLRLPDNWVRSSLTSGMTALDTSLAAQPVESDRQVLGLGGNIHVGAGVSLYADYRNVSRDGIQIVSGANFLQASLLPRFIDFETDLLDLGVRYENGPLQVSAAWFGSYFDNSAHALQWDNPFTPFPGAEQGTMALEPDNEFQQVSVSGTYRASPFDTVIAFSAATGQAEQNQNLLPYTSNALLGAESLTVSAFDGRIDTGNYSFVLTSRPIENARIRLGYRFDERDNRSPQSTWSRVVVDSFTSNEDETNTPYGYERTRLSAGGSYRLFDWLRISGALERTELERDFQEVAEQTEDRGWIRVRTQPANWLDLSVKGGTSRREIDRYDTEVADALGQNPLLRKYYLAHRYREFAELNAAIAPAELPISVALSARWADDSYSKSRLGLTDSRALHIAADVSYTFNDRVTAYLNGGYEDIEATQLGSATFSTPTWSAEHDDRFDHYGAGLQVKELSEAIDLGVDYQRSDGRTAIHMQNRPLDSPFPDIESTLQSFRLILTYRRSERTDIDVAVRYESLESKDWALAGVEPDTIDTVLSLGAMPFDEDAWVLGVGFRYRVGE